MRIVLDSNIIIAAFSSRGLCNSIFELCIEKYEVIISSQIINEVSKNLEKKFKMTRDSISLIIDYLNDFCCLLEYEIIPEDISRDKDDDGIISLAYHNNAEYIITGDKDLLILKKYKSINILTPRGFWEISKKDRNI